MALPDEMDERISALEESLTKLEEELDPLLSTPWEQLTGSGPVPRGPSRALCPLAAACCAQSCGARRGPGGAAARCCRCRSRPPRRPHACSCPRCRCCASQEAGADGKGQAQPHDRLRGRLALLHVSKDAGRRACPPPPRPHRLPSAVRVSSPVPLPSSLAAVPVAARRGDRGRAPTARGVE